MFTPNILITNFCNQNCTFCFASKEMGSKTLQREMSLPDFKKVLSKLKSNSSISVVKLLGGEPTLHSQFPEIINASLKHFSYVQVFTNGIFSDTLAQFLKEKLPKIGFTFNVMTPGFLFNKETRKLVSERILSYIHKTKVTLSFTFDMHSNMEIVFDAIKKNIISGVDSFRLGFSNPTAGERNYYTFSDFPKVGKKLIYIVSHIRKHNKNAKIHLNCGFTRCMFTNEEFDFLQKEHISITGFGCFGKDASFDLQTDLTAFHCFPLSQKDKLTTQRRSFSHVNNDLIKKRFTYWGNIIQSVCKTCPFYGIGRDKCPGPCIAFLMNKKTHCSN